MKKNLILVIVLVLVVLGAVLYQSGNLPFVSGMYGSSTHATSSLPNEPAHNEPVPVVQTGHKLGQAKVINGVTITPLAVTEDSRCPQGVQCVWAGTVKVSTKLSKPSGNSTQVIELGKPLNIGTETVTLVSVTPYPKAGGEMVSADYRFVFEVKPNQAVTENPGKGGCYVGGCSGQICSDEPGAISTCEWTEAYACYQTARCERQANGQCGWTPTTMLNMCLQEAR